MKSIKQLKNKLASTKGETLVETLISFFLIVVVFTCLALAVAASARVNAAIDPAETVYNFTGQKELSASVSIVHDDVTVQETEVIDNVEGFQTKTEDGKDVVVYYSYSNADVDVNG